ncbi:MAG TPA: methyltransferase domain-containing protein [Polyangiales bacterium]|nr:methyltransferase domain-containing protein [Polyangiales bacterium]
MTKDLYTHGHHDSVLRSHRWRTVDNSAAYLRPHLAPAQRLLDVGCGPATLTVDLARHVPNGRVVAIDRAEAVLGEARAAVAASGMPIEVAAGDVYALQFAAAAFDVVHAHQVLQHLSEPVRALREMRRVCAPEGLVAARDSDYGSFRWYPEDPRLDAWLRLYHRVAESNQAYPDAGRRLLEWARAAGFREVTISASVWCFATPESRSWWSDLWAERITESAMAEQALSRGFATREELASMAEAFRAWGASHDGYWTLTHGELLARP